MAWLVAPARAQVAAVSLEEAKAHYTLEVAEQLTWPDESAIDQFRIGIVGDESALLIAFEALEATRTIHGKPIEIAPIRRVDASIADYALVYVSWKARGEVPRINSLRGDALVVVDGPVRRAQQMVSLIEQAEQILIRINRDRLVESGFAVSSALVEIVGSKEDLSRQLKDTEQALRSLAAEASEKESILNELNLSRLKSEADLEKAQRSLAKAMTRLRGVEAKLEQQQSEIARAEARISENQVQLAEQQRMMAAKQTEIDRKVRQMQGLQSAIAENDRILEDQLARIRAQTSIISRKEQTIGSQRYTLRLVAYVGVALVVFLAVLVRLNQLRTRANRELAALNGKLYELATTDGLSKLFNRRHFSETAHLRIRQMQRSRTPAAVLMLDIDFFKQINDRYGHAMGDEVIVAVARVLHENLREYDIVGRMGGEEFAMLLSGADRETALVIAERLRSGIEQTSIEHNGVEARVTISIGISLIRADDKALDQPLNRADSALYEAKQSGRNQIAVFAD